MIIKGKIERDNLFYSTQRIGSTYILSLAKDWVHIRWDKSQSTWVYAARRVDREDIQQ